MANTELTEQQAMVLAWWDQVQPTISHNTRVDLVSICMSVGGNILDRVRDAAFNCPDHSPEHVLTTITEALSDTEANGPMLRQMLRQHRSPDATATQPYMTAGDGEEGPGHD